MFVIKKKEDTASPAERSASLTRFASLTVFFIGLRATFVYLQKGKFLAL